ncbi:MAG TPA: hypothetical protein VN325_27085 [Steroidobacteraceae bacterium]|nr:hypothetical protein [Steroidobacteraceae bacterium]
MPQLSSLDHPLTGKMPAAVAAGALAKHAVLRFSLAALGAVALYSAPAVAQDCNFTDNNWSIDLSGGYIPTRASRVVSGDTNLGLTTVITYGHNVTANLGIGTRYYYVTTNLFWDLGIRAWYLDSAVSLEMTPLTTAGAGTA